MRIPWVHRLGPLLGEVAALLVTTAADVVLVARAPFPGLVGELAVQFGTVAAVLVVLRRRFPARLAGIGAAVVGLSVLVTAVLIGARALGGTTVLGGGPAFGVLAPFSTEVLALALLAGAGARRLTPRLAAALTVGAVVAMVAAPLGREGLTGYTVVAALLWGAAVAVGLILRDGDNRHRAAVTEVRTGERLRLARELHDLVAQHITGVVVRTQAAQRVTAQRGGDPGPFAEIEAAGGEALAAMRRLVGMLRTDGADLFAPPSGIVAAVDRAVPDDGSVTLHVPDGLADVDAKPEVVSTAHRLLSEALTNVTRHAQPTETTVTVDTEPGWLLLEVVNDGARPGRGDGGYGLVGMTERVTAVGGTVRAGREPGQRWRVSARLPLEATGARGATGDANGKG